MIWVRLDSTLRLGVALSMLLAPACTAQTSDLGPETTVVHASNLPSSEFYLARNTLVEIELLETLDTATTRRNQPFHYRVLRDIKGDGGVVIAGSTEGTGLVRESRKGGKRGTARFQLSFGDVQSVESRPVKLGFTLPALRANDSPGGLRPIIGGYFESNGNRARLASGQRLLVAVEFPYGSRLIPTTAEGAQYHTFQSDPVQD